MSKVSKTVRFRISPRQYEWVEISATTEVEYEEGEQDKALSEADAMIKDALRNDLQEVADITVDPESIIFYLSDNRFPAQTNTRTITRKRKK